MQNNTLPKNRQAFYSQLESMFAGRELKNFKGKSGFANLLSIKSDYFKHIKKELNFILKDLSKGEKTITLLVLYKGQKVDLGDDYSFELNSKIAEKEYALISSNKANLKKFDELLNNYELDITPGELSRAIYTYKKQREIDFFIHKDSESFLKEQFNLYMYNYLFNDDEIKFNDWDIQRLQQIKNIKEIIFETIELLSKFEDELRAMWLKPKFVRNLNYIITLDKVDSKFHDEIFEVKKQVDEWRELELIQDDALIKNEFLPVDTRYLNDEFNKKYPIFKVELYLYNIERKKDELIDKYVEFDFDKIF